MKRWWAERSDRERTLLVMVSVIVIALAFWQGVVAPTMRFRAGAEAEWRAATDQSVEARQLARRIRELTIRTGTREPAPDARIAVTVAARQSDISISRLLPVAEGGVEVWVDAADAARLFDWLATMHDRYGVTIVKASIARRDGDSQIRAQVMLAGGEAP